jgi:RimJ/RimL family protein N-acetyltransferase
VLEKCGFVVTGRERGFANARGEEIDEVVLILVGGTDDSGRDRESYL